MHFFFFSLKLKGNFLSPGLGKNKASADRKRSNIPLSSQIRDTSIFDRLEITENSG